MQFVAGKHLKMFLNQVKMAKMFLPRPDNDLEERARDGGRPGSRFFLFHSNLFVYFLLYFLFYFIYIFILYLYIYFTLQKLHL